MGTFSLISKVFFRPYLSKLSYRAPKWALMVRLMQKERLRSPQKSPILENQAIGVILAILAKTAIWVIVASHFRTRVDAPGGGNHLGPCFYQRDRATFVFVFVYIRPTGSQATFSTAGALPKANPGLALGLGFTPSLPRQLHGEIPTSLYVFVHPWTRRYLGASGTWVSMWQKNRVGLRLVGIISRTPSGTYKKS